MKLLLDYNFGVYNYIFIVISFRARAGVVVWHMERKEGKFVGSRVFWMFLNVFLRCDNGIAKDYEEADTIVMSP